MKPSFANRCLSCGLLLRHHRDAKNRSMTCEEARRVHPRATVVKKTLRELLFAAPKSERHDARRAD